MIVGPELSVVWLTLGSGPDPLAIVSQFMAKRSGCAVLKNKVDQVDPM